MVKSKKKAELRIMKKSDFHYSYRQKPRADNEDILWTYSGRNLTV